MKGQDCGLELRCGSDENTVAGKKIPATDIENKKENHTGCSSALRLRHVFNSVRVIRSVSTTSKGASLGNFTDAPRGTRATSP